MKITLSLLLLTTFSMLFCGCTNAQEKAPQAVQEAFEKKYPGENDPDWHKDSHGNFESNFKIDGKKYRADFSPNGNWIETELSIKKGDLPNAVRKTIATHYEELEISEIEEVDHHRKGRFYDVEFKQKGKNKDVEINTEGKVIN